VKLWPENIVVVSTPGAGGYGTPKNRTKDALRQDLASGKFTEDFLNKHYKNNT
jgi:N-methylhydantoinase B